MSNQTIEVTSEISYRNQSVYDIQSNGSALFARWDNEEGITFRVTEHGQDTWLAIEADED